MWIIGIIFADLKFFIFGLIILAFIITLVNKNHKMLKNLRNKDGTAMKDERNELIIEKAGNIAYEIIIFLMVFMGVCILTLRNIYPEQVIIAYVLILTGIVSFIINRIAKFYYKNRL